MCCHQGQPGHGAPKPEKKLLFITAGVGVCFVLIFLKKLEPNQLFKMLLQDSMLLGDSQKGQIQAECMHSGRNPCSCPDTLPETQVSCGYLSALFDQQLL